MTTKIFVRNLKTDLLIGIHDHEKKKKQPVVVTVEADVDIGTGISDDIENTVSYSPIVLGIRQLASSGHINLVETLAEKIATLTLNDKRVREVMVRVEKTTAYDDTDSVGVEIRRKQPQ